MSIPEKALQVGDVLESRYRIDSQSSRHDLGETYQAFDLLNHRPVEVLVLPPCLAKGVEALNPVRWANRIVADLQQPTLVPFEDAGWLDERPFLVRRRVSGRSLAESLARVGTFKVETAVEITISLCEALAPLHRAGLAHGGLAPHSILVGAEGRGIGSARRGSALSRVSQNLIILDAGLLPAIHPLYDPPDQPWGRFPYLSPEQAAGGEVSPASDVYVLGLLLFEMLTGRPLFRATEKSVLALQHLRQAPSLQVLPPEAPSSLVQIVQRTLAKEPAARYRHAGQLAQLLRSQLTSEQTRAAPMPSPGPVAQLVVPPPPLPVAPVAPDHTPAPAPRVSTEHKEEERPDWLLIGLMIAALIAVLGLIPLWHTVYRRYTSLPPVGVGAYSPDDSAWITSCPSLTTSPHREGPTSWRAADAGIPSAVRILENKEGSESSLRVFCRTCTTLKRQWSVEV